MWERRNSKIALWKKEFQEVQEKKKILHTTDDWNECPWNWCETRKKCKFTTFFCNPTASRMCSEYSIIYRRLIKLIVHNSFCCCCCFKWSNNCRLNRNCIEFVSIFLTDQTYKCVRINTSRGLLYDTARHTNTGVFWSSVHDLGLSTTNLACQEHRTIAVLDGVPWPIPAIYIRQPIHNESATIEQQ